MRIALVTEAWRPQVNGVVTTWTHVRDELTAKGHDFRVFEPQLFRRIPCPKYASIELCVAPDERLAWLLDQFQPDAIHIATEGPLGLAGRMYCMQRGLPFTTSYHTQFPKYLAKYFWFPKTLSYGYMRWFHNAAERILVPTESVRKRLVKRRFRNVVIWGRGVDSAEFTPGDKTAFNGIERPVFMCAGRVALEKNIPAFVSLDLPGTKVVMGEGPVLDKLKKRFPDSVFLGFQPQEQFVEYMRASDVFVFPSRTDTFGLVMLEALASGVPVAAYPTTGPRDVLEHGRTGVMSKDLRQAALDAVELDPVICREHAESRPWIHSAMGVYDNLAWIRSRP